MRQPHESRSSFESRVTIAKTAGGQQIAHGDPDGRPAAEQAAPPFRRIFDREDNRSAVFRAGAKTLQQAQHHQQDRRQNADAGVARDQADQKSGNADQQERDDKHRLAPDPVAEMTKHRPAERPREKADAESGEGGESSDARIELGKKQFVEHQRSGRAVDEEIVPLESRADRGCQHHPPE